MVNKRVESTYGLQKKNTMTQRNLPNLPERRSASDSASYPASDYGVGDKYLPQQQYKNDSVTTPWNNHQAGTRKGPRHPKPFLYKGATSLYNNIQYGPPGGEASTLHGSAADTDSKPHGRFFPARQQADTLRSIHCANASRSGYSPCTCLNCNARNRTVFVRVENTTDYSDSYTRVCLQQGFSMRFGSVEQVTNENLLSFSIR